MADCRDCGAPVRFATNQLTGDRVVLDQSISRYRGPHRYAPVGDDPAVVVPVDPDRPVSAYSGHEETCGAKQLKEPR
jgi:hypothetical protein